MNKRPVFFLSLLIVTAFATSTFAQTQNSVAKITSKDGKTAATPSKAVRSEDIESDIAEALSIIEASHVTGKKLNYNDVFKSTIDGMLHTLDPHSNYFDSKEFEQFRTEQSSRYFGIGATIGDLSDADGKVLATYIRATFENAPANRAGLRYGDKIIEVNGTNVIGKPFPDVRNMLRGPRGTPVKLVIERHGTGKRENVEIIRDAVPQPSIPEAYMIRPGVGYISMTGGFNQTTYAEFADAMRRLKASGMKELVLDLKGNGGGLVNQAYKVANTFLSSGQTVFTQVGRLDGVTEAYQAENPNPETLPLVVLVNRNSASASEILAGALQDHDRALIVGENTFGKGLVQNPFILDYGSMLLLTIAKYQTPSGRLIQRDYSDGNLYDYYTNGGVGNENTSKPKGPESKTDAGRAVYSGGGINPDVFIKADMITNDQARLQAKLANPIFAFALDLAYGKVPGFENYKVDKPIRFGYDIRSTDYPISDVLFAALKEYANAKYKIPAVQFEKERKFVERALRSELVTAAYGSTTSFQVFNEYDTQLSKAIELLPQAKQLASEGAKARMKMNASRVKGEMN
ncbi:MAG: S41 family peptidase [Pyrinomonadaceae bacterium]|nr:S41 family peptidase [Blastocatellia bacterium]MCW5956976.1 S41 family peptidase [Pyrinomonadaceae bacterium]